MSASVARALSIVALLISANALGSDPVVKTSGAQIRGGWVDVHDEPIAQFTGIPFAEPPVNERRWRPPVDVAPKGVIDARAWPNICVQDNGNPQWYDNVAGHFGAKDVMDLPPTSEDCLYLNVWTPDTDARLPVMVWIHGGGNVNGWSWEPNYRGHRLAAKNVVVVSIQYRLGVFGFLAHPALSAESKNSSGNNSSGNYGVLDQLSALRWVQRHIAAFGGDPNNVTVFGESAGAGNIAYLLLSPLADGLFHKAIMQSGGWPAIHDQTLAQDEAEGIAFSHSAGLSLQALRALPANDLLNLASEHYERGYDDPPIDGWLLPDSPVALLSGGRFAPRPVIMGTNADEMLMYVEDATDAALSTAIASLTTDPRDTARIRDALPSTSLSRQLDALAAAPQFHCPTFKLADGLSQRSPTWVYRFDRIRNGGETLGAYHGAEIPYVFDTHDAWLPTDTADEALTDYMTRAWVRFATTGQPHSDWPRWDDTSTLMSLDRALEPQIADRRLCRVLDAVAQP